MRTKKSFVMLAVAGVCLSTTGCNQIRNYSVRSYQGPMPLTEYEHMDASQHGVPAPRPVAADITPATTTPAP